MARSVQVRGLSSAISTMTRLSHAVKVEVDQECRAAAAEMNVEASDYISSHAADQGELLMSQQADYNYAPRSYLVFNDAPYAAYVEFGTGVKFKALPEWVDIAADWKSRPGGKFPEFLEKIREWCIRTGKADPQYAYVICLAILRNGLEPRPFMQTAYEKVKPLLIQRVRNIIRDSI